MYPQQKRDFTINLAVMHETLLPICDREILAGKLGKGVWLEGADGSSVHCPAYSSKRAWVGGILGEFPFYKKRSYKLPSQSS